MANRPLLLMNAFGHCAIYVARIRISTGRIAVGRQLRRHQWRGELDLGYRIALYMKLDWLRQHLSFVNGITSHDTFGQVFSPLDAAQFEARFVRWMSPMCPRLWDKTLPLTASACAVRMTSRPRWIALSGTTSRLERITDGLKPGAAWSPTTSHGSVRKISTGPNCRA